MNEDKIWQLLSLKLSGEASADELNELQRLLDQNSEKHFQVSLLEDFWQSKQSNQEVETEDAFNRHLQRLSNHLSQPTLQYETQEQATVVPLKKINFRSKLLMIISAAAVLMLIVSLVYLFTNHQQANSISQNTVTTKPGSKSKITLPDGSEVWLNAESKLTYNESFGGSTREVELTGEAFFDVVKDKSRPFIIHTNSIDVKVLGTAFNVRSYPGEKTAETSLIRGVVEVTLKSSPDKKIILKPNEKLVVQNADKITRESKSVAASFSDEPLLILSKLHYIKGDSTAIETSWVKNKLAFDGESLENVAGKIKRWYGVEVTITDERLKEGQYSGIFEDESIVEVMDALKLTGGFKYEILKKQVIIKP